MKNFIIILVFVFSTVTLTARVDEENFLADMTQYPQENKTSDPAKSSSARRFNPRNIFIGGGAGVAFGTGATSILLQPTIGYRFNSILSAGVLFNYEYWRQHNISINIYGGGFFGQVSIPIMGDRGGLVIHAEYSAKYYDSNATVFDRGWNNFLPFGFGIYSFSGRSRVSLIALWDLLHLSERYNDGTPTLRASITF